MKINRQLIFWIAGILIGLMIGPNQSCSRSLMSQLTPEKKQNEVKNSNGVIIGTLENFGYMAGASKDFFDRCYNWNFSNNFWCYFRSYFFNVCRKLKRILK